MTVYEIITKKRDGINLTRQEIEFIIDGYTSGKIPDYQMSALLMAIYLNGMVDEELHFLTNAVLHSGKIIDLGHIPGIKVDKHSTGGVGDKVSIILAPIVAAAGVPVPMISGRSLGHTGGTLDKLESIPGLKVDYTAEEFKRILSHTGACLIGQTAELAPADKKMYALRDVTATVQSIPLIGASIMSKKIAEGIDALVLDVKTGAGAFMTDYSQARKLAETLIRIGEDAGKKTIAYITDMSNPLGTTVGNWIEIVECIECLKGNGPDDLMEVTHQLAGAMIYLGQQAENIEKGVKISHEMIANGKAWDKFIEIVKVQKGDIKFLDHPADYPDPKYKVNFEAHTQGWIESINAFDIGMTSILLGAGRQKADDRIDPKAGIRFYYKPGDEVKIGTKLFTIFTDIKKVVDIALQQISNAIKINTSPQPAPVMIIEYLDKDKL